MTKKHFWGKKYILNGGREIDLSCEETNGIISMLAIFNHLDAVHEITKPMSIHLEWLTKESHDPTISIECRGGSPIGSRPVSESELPIEGLNGDKEKLKVSEILELIEIMKNFYSKLA